MALDKLQTYKIKKAAAQVSVEIYDLAMEREQEDDSQEKSRLSEKILDLHQKRQSLLKRIA